MKIIVARDYRELSNVASDFIAAEISKRPNLVLGLATGHTPLELYHQLVKRYKKGGIDFSKVFVFNLDEYYGAEPSEKQSFSYYLHKNLLDRVNINKENIQIIDGKPDSIRKECRRYDDLLSRHKIDLQILGIGINAHIGFDEPGTSFNSKTHLIRLSKSTIKKNFKNKNKKFTQAITIGISNIIAAKKILMLASGREKLNAVREMLCSKISEKVPATILRKHPDVTLIITKDIADKLRDDIKTI